MTCSPPPASPIPSLGEAEIAGPWQALRDVLQGSIDAGGAPFELNLYGQKGGWDDPYLFHWEEGAPCPVDGTPLAKIRTGSTGSHIFPGCQVLCFWIGDLGEGELTGRSTALKIGN